jgi:hypothetical protein
MAAIVGDLADVKFRSDLYLDFTCGGTVSLRRSVGGWIRCLASVLVMVLTVALLNGAFIVSPSAQAAAGSGPLAVRASVSAAVRQAHESGKQVEVGSLLGETSEVYAQPDGTFEAVEHLRPVRTRRNGSWVDIDSTLVKRADGTIAPVASTVDLAFSGGGDGPMATMVRAGRKLSLSWPTPLPAPALSGSTATYKDVITGVDLQLRADVDGFSHLLVVKTREAAQNPQLSKLKFTTATTGVTVHEDADGGLQAVDAGGGGTVFEAQQPLMWDSAKDSVTAGVAAKKDRSATGDPGDGPGGATGSSCSR